MSRRLRRYANDGAEEHEEALIRQQPLWPTLSAAVVGALVRGVIRLVT